MIFEGLIKLTDPLNFKLIEEHSSLLCLKSSESFIHLDLGHRCDLNYLVSIPSSKLNKNASSSSEKNEKVLVFTNTKYDNLDILLKNQEVAIDLALTIDESNNISLIRNPFGIIPLYYFILSEKVFAFSTNLPSLMNINEVRQHLEVESSYISNYCVLGDSAITTYTTSTFFKNIKNVLPGHILNIHKDQVVQRPYLRFTPGQFASYKNKFEFVDKLFELLRKSVQNAMKQEPIGAHISGGLDSSSIATLAKYINRDNPLVSYYSLNETPNQNHTNYAQLVVDKIDSIHYNVDSDNNDFLLLKRDIETLGRPSFSVSSLAKTHSILKHANGLGLKVMLTGYYGDEVIGEGFNHLKNLFNSKKWNELKIELEKRVNDPTNRNLHPNYLLKSDREKVQIIKTHFLNYRIIDLINKEGLVKSYQTIREAAIFFDLNRKLIFKLVLKHFLKKNNRNPFSDLPIKQSKNIESKNVAVNFNPNSTDQAYYSSVHEIFSKSIINLNEEFFSLGNCYQLDIKLPFLDIDLIQLCIETPEEYKYYIGSGRGHLREAMKDLLPEEVVKREDKGYFSNYGRESARRLIIQSKDVLDKNNRVWDYINYKEYKKIESAIMNNDKKSKYYNQGNFYIHKVISLHVWFEWLDNLTKAE